MALRPLVLLFALLFPLTLLALPKITEITFDAESVTLKFDTPLAAESARFSHLGGEQRRNIYDLEAVLLGKAQTGTLDGRITVKIAQNNSSRVRVVFSRNGPLLTKSHYQGKSLRIEARGASGGAPLAQREAERRPPPPYSKSASNKVVVIDAGHGGKDCGAFNRICEKEIVLKVARKVAQELKNHGVKTHLTRSDDTFIRLKNRTNIANEKKADVFVSIHVNAMVGKSAKTMEGVESYFLSPARSTRAKNVAALENQEEMESMDSFSKETFLGMLNSTRIIESNKLAIDVQRGMLLSARKHHPKLVDGGVREGPFWVLVGAQMPSVLVELGYLSHPGESQLLKNTAYQELLARGIAHGILSYFSKNF